MRSSTVIVVLTAVAGCAAPDVSSPDLDAFRFEGKPIHPAILNEFIPWLSDGGKPVIAAVDLEGFTRGRNRLSRWNVEEKNGRVEGQREGNDGYLWYRHLGRGKSGSHFVEILDNGGGSGYWRYLVQLRFEIVDAFGSRRLLLRCENFEDLSCCPFGRVELELMPGPCAHHPRPIPDAELSDVAKMGPSLADPGLLQTWDSHVVRDNLRFGRIRVFPRSIFVERQGSVPFTVVAAVEGKCLLQLTHEMDDCGYMLLDAPSSRDLEPNSIRMSFHRTLEDGRAAFTDATQAGSNWSVAELSSD